MQVLFGDDGSTTEFLGRSFLKKVGRITKKAAKATGSIAKKTITAPSKFAATTVRVVARPVIGKKAANTLSKGVTYAANPFAQARLARKGTQAVIGKKNYAALSKSNLNPLNNKAMIAAAASNFIIPGSGVAVAAGIKGARNLRAQVRNAVPKITVPRGFMTKQAAFLPTQKPQEVIQDIVKRNIPQIFTPETVAPETPVPDNKKNLMIAGGIGLAVVFMMMRKK